MSESELRELLAKATPGPWDIWRERAETREAAIAELREQVEHTEPFCGELFLLNANGKCPAVTGCGPTSEANAALIVAAVNALPGLLDELSTLRARVAEVEREAGERMNPKWAASYLYIHGYLTERERDACRKRIEGERHE